MSFRALCVLGVVLMLFMGTAQAVHSHPVSTASHHSCSICASPHVNLLSTTVSSAAITTAVVMATMAEEGILVSRTTPTNFVRPPPAV